MPSASTAPRGRVGGRVAAAQALARHLLGHDVRRINHVAGVARAAAFVAANVPDVDENLVVSAAWLHDVGHARPLARTGFHPLDGAVYLQQGDWDDAIVRLVAHHSHSRVTAEAIGAGADLQRFAPLEGLLADILTFADVIAGPDGTGVSTQHRLAELRTPPRTGRVLPEGVREERYRLLTESVRAVHAALPSTGLRRNSRQSDQHDAQGS
jgi:hypothetical protein